MGEAAPNSWIQLRTTSSATASATQTVRLTYGGLTTSWNVTTVSAPVYTLTNWGGGILTPTGTEPSDIKTNLVSGLGFQCGLKAGGIAMCWGSNGQGQLGNAGASGYVPMSGTWSSLKAGIQHGCGVKTDGTGWCWGYGLYGQLGNGATTTSNVPVAVAGGGTWTKISPAYTTTCGIKSDGTLWCWGFTYRGAIGNSSYAGQNVILNSPVQVTATGTWKDVWGGFSYGHCGIKSDDTLWCWGENSDGQNGISSLTDAMVPTQVSGGPYKSGSRSSYATCALTTAGAAKCWGGGYAGSLGNGIVSDAKYTTPQTVLGGHVFTKIVSMAGNGDRFCALKADGSAWCWGENTSGGLGDGTKTTRSSPVQVSGPYLFSDLALNSSVSFGLTR
jgi:alpha-tubulin suppressor-like RCC1 family protein